MINQLQDGDIIDDSEVKLVHRLVNKLSQIVALCGGHRREWLNGFSGDHYEALEWLEESRKLLEEIDDAQSS